MGISIQLGFKIVSVWVTFTPFGDIYFMNPIDLEVGLEEVP